jgi:hypothetical protein
MDDFDGRRTMEDNAITKGGRTISLPLDDPLGELGVLIMAADGDGRGSHRRRCTATARSGERCGRSPALGATVCYYHGGAAPQVKAKAQERLRALQHPAIDALARALEQRTDLAAALRAALAVLDRTGLGPRNTIDVIEGGLMQRLAELEAHGEIESD